MGRAETGPCGSTAFRPRTADPPASAEVAGVPAGDLGQPTRRTPGPATLGSGRRLAAPAGKTPHSPGIPSHSLRVGVGASDYLAGVTLASREAALGRGPVTAFARRPRQARESHRCGFAPGRYRASADDERSTTRMHRATYSWPTSVRFDLSDRGSGRRCGAKLFEERPRVRSRGGDALALVETQGLPRRPGGLLEAADRP
jgi:hypothetical protein